MTGHLYSIGQRVSFDGRVGLYLKRAGVFTVTKLLPPLGTELQYRVKSDSEAYERVAREHELQAETLGKPAVTAETQPSPVEEKSAERFFAGIS
ncbi:MAG TPA: hypothetical protein VL996_13595 [Methylocella sp.]|nr:hypothetical protein [Methylocella sp.]